MKFKNVILTTSFFLFAAYSVSAQVLWSARAGMNLSKYTHVTGQWKPGFQVGGIIDIPVITKNLFIETGLYMCSKNFYYEISSKDYDKDIMTLLPRPEHITTNGTAYSLLLPIVFSYKIPITTNWGMQLSAGGFCEYFFTGTKITKSDYYNGEGPITHTSDFDDYSAGLSFGISALYKKTTLLFFYDLALEDGGNYWDLQKSPKMSCFRISLGYNF